MDTEESLKTTNITDSKKGNFHSAPANVVRRHLNGLPLNTVTAFDASLRYRADARSGKKGYTLQTAPLSAGADFGDVQAVALPVRLAFCRQIRSPFSSRRKTYKVLDTLLDVELPFAVEQCCTGIVSPFSSKSDQDKILISGCRRSDLERFLATLPDGTRPLLIDHQGLALWTGSVVEIPPATPDIVRLVIWLDDQNSCVAVGQGEQFIDAHPLRGNPDEAFRRLLRHYAERLNNGWEALLSGDIQDSNNWQKTVEECGGSCRIHADPATFLVRNVALRALYSGAYRCNLAPDTATHPWVIAAKKRRDRQRGGLTAALAIITAFSAIIINNGASRIEKQMTAKVAALAEALAGYPVNARGEHAVTAVKNAVEQRQTAFLPLHYIAKPPITPRLNLLHSAADISGIRFSVINLTPQQLEITGISPNESVLQSLLSKLSQQGWHIARDDQNPAENGIFFEIRADKLL